MTTMDEDTERVLYDLEVIPLSASGVKILDGLAGKADAAWYVRRRRRALAAAGLLGATKFNPLLHPRGHDGKFIERWGIVRWLVGGVWHRGVVRDIAGDGEITVEPLDGGMEQIFRDPKQLYSVPKPKARLDLPTPGETPFGGEGWKKVGGQAGSNKGGFYEVDGVMSEARRTSWETAESAAQAAGLEKIGIIPGDDPLHLPEETIIDTIPDYALVAAERNDGSVEAHVFLGLSPSVKEQLLAPLVGPPGSAQRLRWQIKARFWTGDRDNLIRAENSIQVDYQDDPTPGDKYYVKKAKSTDHARQEYLANRLYELAGVAVPPVSVGTAPGGSSIASKIIDGDRSPLSAHLDDPEVLKAIQEDLPVDAWLANWDVVGLTYDNIAVIDGVPWRLDAGGALSYRAQGAAKGAQFGDQAKEIITLRDVKINPQAAAVFTKLPLGKAAVERIAAITPAQIIDEVAAAGVDQSVADKLIARRKWLMSHFSVPEPPMDLSGIGAVKVAEAVIPTPPEAEIAVIPSGPASTKLTPNSRWDWRAGHFVEAPSAGTIESLRQKLNSNLANWPEQTVSKDDALQRAAQGNPVLIKDMYGRAWYVTGEASGSAYSYSATFNVRDAATGETNTEYLNIPLTALQDDSNRLASHRMLTDAIFDAEATRLSKEKQPKDMFGYSYGLNLKNPTRVSYAKNYDMESMIKSLHLGEKSILTRPDANDSTPDDRRYHYVWRAESDYGPMKITSIDEDGTLHGEFVDGRPAKYDYSPGLVFKVTNERFTDITLDAMFESARLKREEDAKASGKPDQVAIPDEKPDTEELGSAIDATTGADLDKSPADPHPDPQPKSIDGVSTDLETIGDPLTITHLTQEEVEATFNDDLIGRTFLFGDPAEMKKGKSVTGEETISPEPGTRMLTGVWKVTGVETVESTNGRQLLLISSNGKKNSTYVHSELGDDSFYATRIVELDATPQPSPPASFKKDGSLVVNGVKVGTWQKTGGYSWSSWQVTIDPAYSVYGQRVQYSMKPMAVARKNVLLYVTPALKTVVHVDKTSVPDAQALESATVNPPSAGIPSGPSAGKMFDGNDASVGQWVVSIKDNFTGKITGLWNQEKNPGRVSITAPDGTVKSRAASKLKAIPDPTKPEVVAPFADIKMKDGTTSPAPDMTVTAGTAKPITGVIKKVNPDGGLLIHDQADGKNKWRPAGTATLVSSPVSSDAAASAAIKADATHKPSTPGTPTVAAKYPAADGSVIPQDADFRDRWVTGGRLLTKDGYVPMPGMRIRDAGGKQYVLLQVKSQYQAAPDSVELWNPIDKKFTWRKVSGLWVDHAAELSDIDGVKSVPRVGTVVNHADGNKIEDIHDGSVIYRVRHQVYDHSRGSYKTVDRYYIVNAPTSPDQGQQVVRTLTGSQTHGVFANSIEVERVAVVDSSSPLVAEGTTPKSGDAVFAAFDPTKTSYTEVVTEKELEEIKLAEVAGVIAPPKTVDKASLTPLPDPPQPVDAGIVEPDPPPVTGAGSLHDEVPPALKGTGAKSILGAVDTTIANADSSAPQSSLYYGLGDTDYVEDMTVRTQMVFDKNGQQYVELRFRLLEDKVDDLADKLTTQQGGGFGAWDGTIVSAKDLVPGDAIHVRISSQTGALKPGGNPSGGGAPNARVIEAGKIIGKSKSGFDVYRLRVGFENGKVGELDLEQRPSPSIVKYEYDPKKPVPGTGKISLTKKAQAEGWTAANTAGLNYQRGETAFGAAGYGVFTNDKGVKNVGAQTQTPVTGNGAFSLVRHLDGGTSIGLNVVSTASGGRTVRPGGGTHSDSRRGTPNGVVTIQVPVTKTTSGLKYDEKQISRALEAVGIPVDAQGPPKPEQLARMAINKVEHQYAPAYHHMSRPNATGLPGDPGTADVLGLVDDAIGSYLKRPVTLNDVRLKVWDVNGRVSFVMSDDVARAVTKRQSRGAYTHQSGGGLEALKHILGGPVGGLLSSDERWAAGIFVGNTPIQDMENDAGNRVYFHARSGNGVSSLGTGLAVPAVTMNKTLDGYMTTTDTFGARQSANVTWFSPPGGAEWMYKRRLELDQIGYVHVSSDSDKSSLIAYLKSQGVTEIRGIPIEDLIVTYTGSPPSEWDQNTQLGGPEIPLDEIVAGAEVPVPAATGAPVA